MVRPIDIARKLRVSTTTLRNYEALGLTPPVPRSATGYRVYTEEHVAYFVAIREMMAGFGLAGISQMLQAVISKRTSAALWMATKAQAELHQERLISERIVRHLLHKARRPLRNNQQLLTINDVSRETGISATTIRYWDKVGLISAERMENNYRMFTAEQVRRVLTIYALKLSVYAAHQRYFIDSIKSDLESFDYNDRPNILKLAKGIEHYLDQVNRDQIKGIAALHRLCDQVEANNYTQ